jgi:undecaprenyl-diphosphatase
VLASGWHVGDRYSADLQRYAPQLAFQHMDSGLWWQAGWVSLPIFRQDLAGEDEQPLNLQWRGSLASLHAVLIAQGWKDPVPLTASTALRWLLAAPAIAELPVLPQVHAGRHEALVMISPPAKGPENQAASIDRNQQLVLRLWHSGLLLNPGEDPVWIGNVTLQAQRQILFLRLPFTLPEYDSALQTLMASTADIERRVVNRLSEGADEASSWQGNILLMRAARSGE